MTFRRRLGHLVPGGSDPSSRASVGKARGRMLRAKPPNVVGRGPLLGGPGFGVVIVCIVKDEAEYLEEWLAYHVALGVDHFVIYDNGSTDGSAELLERYINHGLVTRIDWPLGGGQLAAYNHALRMFGATTRWLAYYDVDEFLVPLADDDIPSFLARFDDAAVVRVPRLEFGYSGHRSRPAGLTIDEYTQVANVLALDLDLPPRVKSIVQPAAVSAVDIHLAFPADVPAAGAPTATAEAEVRGLAQLNHYYTRSFEEFEEKRFRGSATGRIARPAVPFDIKTIATDDSARRFGARTRQTLERLHRLDPRPYAYGSQLALEYFPRPNDLFRFGEFAIANTAAGLAEPARVAATRLKNRYPGIGLVADLAETGYRPERDGLTTSLHTEVLLQHMRGRLATSLSSAGQLPMRAMAGTFDIPPAGPAHLALQRGRADLTLELAHDEVLRSYTLGFVVSSSAGALLEASVVDHDGASGEPVAMELPASTVVAGIVEVEPRPVGGALLRLRASGESRRLDVYDLFVIATG
jgi:hypothetical protein